MIELLWILLLAPLVAGILAEQRMRAVFERYRAVRNQLGVTGAELARALLDAHGLDSVRLELAPGALTDHYDGATRTLRLSAAVGRSASVAALGIAAHEVSHAVQDAEGSRAYRVRRAVGEPLAKLAPYSGVFFIGGFWFGVPLLMVLTIVLAAGLVLFALVTLPVEFGASRRAVELLRAARLVDARELAGVRRVLSVAALTYVVGLVRQLGFLLALILLAETARRVAT